MQYQVAREQLQSPPATISWLSMLFEAALLATTALVLVFSLGL